MKFEKDNLESIKGRQPSKWDVLLEHLTEPGDRLKFDPADVSKPAAAQGAARLRKLTGKAFHSGFDAIEKKTFIRLRMPDEVDDDKEEEVKQEELKPVSQSLADTLKEED